MSTMFGIIIYLILVFGIIMVAISFCENSLNNADKYIRIKNAGVKVRMKLEISGIEEKERNLIINIIEKGKFENIYDIVDSYIVE